ncbi:MAG: tripartite tricarboxylate transporter substrate binding protein, partial [Alphaproteobacteria bacterium]|nr:tripartite tricarboxylate transporter substrate binding protein [Alphaproteobacteria bacterium]
QASEDAELYREYLKQFPNGTFAGLARRKIEQLAKPPPTAVTNQQQAAVTPPPQPALPAPAPMARPAVGSFPTAFPTGPIRLVVPFPPGGSVDAIAHTVAQPVSALLGQPVIIENRVGAGDTIGTATVAKAAPDGYTLLVATNPHVTNRFVMKDVPYDGVRDFAPVALLASGSLVLALHPALPVRDYREFVQLLKSRPDAVNFASGGLGSLSHLAAEWFKAKAGVRAVHVPYRGSAPAIADTVAGHVQFLFDSVATLKSQIDARRLRALAVTGPARAPQLAAVPTTAELGLDSVTVWYAILAPAQVPAAIVGKLNAAFGQVMADPRVAESIAALGLAAHTNAPPEAVSRFLASEVAKWGTVVQAAGIRPE